MSDDKLFDEMLNVIEKANTGDLIFANFVEFDTLYGHRRDLPGYARALEVFDKQLPKLFSILNRDDFLLITADHGNCEQMIKEDGSPHTAHTTNLVHLVYVGEDYENVQLNDGVLADIAPTILNLLDIQAPDEMEGSSLIFS